MATTAGFVGTIESEARGTPRVWFSLTERATGNAWIEIDSVRAWFTFKLGPWAQNTRRAQFKLLLAALRDGLHVNVDHRRTNEFRRDQRGDSFEVRGVRVLRAGLRFTG